MRFPDYPAQQGKILIWAQQVQQYLRFITPRLGGDILPDSTPGGTRLIYKPRWLNPQQQVLPDFSLYDGGASDGQANLGIGNGIVTAFTNMTMDDGVGPMPSGMDPTGANPYILPVAASDTYAWIGMTIDNSDDTTRTVTSLYIDSGNSIPTSDDDSTLYIPLGAFGVNPTTFAITVSSGAWGIGDQALYAERNWNTNDPVVYNYAAGQA